MPVSYYILFAGIFLVLLAAVPYVVYLFGMTFGKKIEPINLDSKTELPNISIVVCAYNEERTIADKIKSISNCTYPKDKIEFILAVDCADDNTVSVAQDALNNVEFKWIIHENEKRSGKNGSFNNGMKIASNNIIIDSDADVEWGKDSIEILVRRLIQDENIAVVSGDLQPRVTGEMTSSLEKTYRSYFGKMSEWEGANDATYIINGCLLALRRDVIEEITTCIGPDDANIAFVAIRKGYRILYDGAAKVYEDIPESMKKQYSQKARRAKGIIQATLANKDLMKQKRIFSRVFYPLRIWMYVVTPTLFFIGTLAAFIGLLLSFPLLAVLAAIFLVLILRFGKNTLITSFITNQFYLFMGLYSRRKDAVIWQSTSKKVGE
jgi:cellulose synthase/poly-beta-1,6-N-acetylglucosamine synthase-like glycosyltransferase